MEAENRANIALTGQQVEAEKNLLLQLSQLGQQSALGLGQIGAGTGASVANSTANMGQFQLTRGQLKGQGIDDFVGMGLAGATAFSGMGGLSGAAGGAQVGSTAQGSLQAANAQRLFPISGF